MIDVRQPLELPSRGMPYVLEQLSGGAVARGQQ